MGQKGQKPPKTPMEGLLHLFANIGNLVDVKSLMTFGFTGATIWGFATDRVSTEVFMPVVASIITYYFTKKGGD